MEVTRNIATLKLSEEEHKILAKAQSIILKIDDELLEEEYLSDGDFSEVSHKDIGTCLDTLNFFLKGRAVSAGGEGIFYIERED